MKISPTQHERLGWVESAEIWFEIRKLRKQMVHEYIEDLAILTSALQAGHHHVATLVTAGQLMMAEAQRLMTLRLDDPMTR